MFQCEAYLVSVFSILLAWLKFKQPKG